ncbi:MAG: sigma factor-like helix-turn-helix DNA-binding protein [Porcipelethomonas sp.]
MAKNLDYGMLLECYGAVLTENQRNLMELYYWEDMSLGEISETCGITRQGVRDGIKRGEHTISRLEEKLKLADRILRIREICGRICSLEEKSCGENADEIIKLALEGRELF